MDFYYLAAKIVNKSEFCQFEWKDAYFYGE